MSVFAGHRYAVVGLGRSGLPVAQRLVELGAEVTAWDDSAAAREAATGLHVALPDMAGLDAMVLSPGIPHTLPAPHPLAAEARAAGVPIWSDAELLYRAVRGLGSRARFVGITGTNGKSTTTALVAHLLAAAGVPVAAGGNLGTPALALPLLPQDGVYVLEMSSYMLERLDSLRFDVAAMLNLSPDHLDRHGDMAGYVAAKQRIFAGQTADDVAVAGVDDTPSRALADWLGTRPARTVRISAVDPLPPLPATLRGAHNAQNAAAALAVVEALMPASRRTEWTERLTSFAGLPHRQELVATIGGVAWVNDSKATNADSAARALAAHDNIIWIAGGIAKAGGITSLSEYFPRVLRALLIGRAADAFAATLGARGVANDVVDTLDRAVTAAAAVARTGATVLLSPACASFDQFANFEARGERFRALVAQLRAA